MLWPLLEPFGVALSSSRLHFSSSSLGFSPCCRSSEGYDILPEMVGHLGRCSGICARNFGLRDSGTGSRAGEQASGGECISFLSDLHARNHRRRRCCYAGRRPDYWVNCATGFLWRTWLLLYILPLVACRRTSSRESVTSSCLCKNAEGAGFPFQVEALEDGVDDAIDAFHVHEAHHGTRPPAHLHEAALDDVGGA